MKVRDLIKSLGPKALNMDAAAIVLVIASDGAPHVAGTSDPSLSKRLLEMALAGDWNIARTVN